MTKMYYKFRDFTHPVQLKECLDKQTLHMCNYKSMRERGDKGEGVYYVPMDCPDSVTKMIHQAKMHLMICSVSKHLKLPKMWKNYAADGMGMCIAFTIDETIEGDDVRYKKDYPFMIPCKIDNDIVYSIAKEILKHKLYKFGSEDEYRLFKLSYDSDYSKARIKIHAVHLGWNISEADERYWRSFIASHCGNSVKIIRRRKPIV